MEPTHRLVIECKEENRGKPNEGVHSLGEEMARELGNNGYKRRRDFATEGRLEKNRMGRRNNVPKRKRGNVLKSEKKMEGF